MSDSPAITPRPETQTRVIETQRGNIDLLECGQGQPLLYFHGTGATSEIVPVLEHDLVEAGFRLIVPNRPGYHGTPLRSGPTPQECADLAAAGLDRLAVDRAAVIGMSGGGPAAACFAARHPERTVALVLECAMSHPFTAARWLPRRMKWMSHFLRWPRLVFPIVRLGFAREIIQYRRQPNRIMRNMAGVRYADIDGDPLTAELAALFVSVLLGNAQQPQGLKNDWANAVGKSWLTPGTIHAPTLVVHDRLDPIVPFAHAEWAAQSIAGAQLCDLRLAGHVIWLGGEAAEMRHERLAFLRAHAGDGRSKLER